MGVFNNSTMVQGFVNHVGVYDNGNYQTLFLRISIFSYIKNEKKHYESINAQISCKVDQEGNSTSTSSHPKSQVNKGLFDYLNNNVAEGMPIKIRGSLKGNEQVYLEGKWRNFKDLNSTEKESYQLIPKNELITRNQTFLYIEDANVPKKSTYLNKNKKQEPDSQMDGLKASEPEQADSIETDDNDPVDNAGVVQEKTIDSEIVEVEKMSQEKSQKNYVEPVNHYYYDPNSSIDIDDMDIPF